MARARFFRSLQRPDWIRDEGGGIGFTASQATLQEKQFRGVGIITPKDFPYGGPVSSSLQAFRYKTPLARPARTAQAHGMPQPIGQFPDCKQGSQQRPAIAIRFERYQT
jgi:hypothetical protein